MGVYEKNASSVKEYAYTEDKNFRFRPSMEDSNHHFLRNLQHILLRTGLTETPTAEFLAFSMVMAVDRSLIIVQNVCPMNSEKKLPKPWGTSVTPSNKYS